MLPVHDKVIRLFILGSVRREKRVKKRVCENETFSDSLLYINYHVTITAK